MVEIHQNPSIFEGKYFITFSTTDKQTGINYYKVKEGKRDWQRAASPDLLNNQNLSDIIKVRAMDKAGNERTAECPPSKKPLSYWIIIFIIIGIGIIIWRIHKIIKKQ